MGRGLAQPLRVHQDTLGPLDQPTRAQFLVQGRHPRPRGAKLDRTRQRDFDCGSERFRPQRLDEIGGDVCVVSAPSASR